MDAIIIFFQTNGDIRLRISRVANHHDLALIRIFKGNGEYSFAIRIIGAVSVCHTSRADMHSPRLDKPAVMRKDLIMTAHDNLADPCQIGCCWAHNSRMNALEYHRSSEHNIAVSDMLLILADQREMAGLELPAGKPVAFYVPRGTVIELYDTTMHYSPCQVHDEGFRCIVILPCGTNSPWNGPYPQGVDAPLLWSTNKWMIAHPENEWAVIHGGYPGLRGENFLIRYPS